MEHGIGYVKKCGFGRVRRARKALKLQFYYDAANRYYDAANQSLL